MKTILFLLAIATMVVTGCQSTSSANNNANPNDNLRAALPDNGNMPTGPAGGGILNQH